MAGNPASSAPSIRLVCEHRTFNPMVVGSSPTRLISQSPRRCGAFSFPVSPERPKKPGVGPRGRAQAHRMYTSPCVGRAETGKQKRACSKANVSPRELARCRGGSRHALLPALVNGRPASSRELHAPCLESRDSLRDYVSDAFKDPVADVIVRLEELPESGAAYLDHA